LTAHTWKVSVFASFRMTLGVSSPCWIWSAMLFARPTATSAENSWRVSPESSSTRT
jgi:hypothetical protein